MSFRLRYHLELVSGSVKPLKQVQGDSVRTQLPGYSLIEIAIVLVIVGIMAGYGLPMLTGMQQSAKNQVTHKHQDHIIHALASYALINGRLPLPLDTFSSGGGILIGFVPHLELGISEDLAKDGFRNRMVYVVAKSMVVTEVSMAPIVDNINNTLNDPIDSQTMMNGLGEGEEDEEDISSPPPITSSPSSANNRPVTNNPPHNSRYFCEAKSPIILKNGDKEKVYNEEITVPFLLIGFAQRGLDPTPQKKTDLSHYSEPEQVNLNSSSVFYARPLNFKGETVFRQIIAHISRNHLMEFYARKPCESNATISN